MLNEREGNKFDNWRQHPVFDRWDQFESIFKTRCIALCSPLPISTVQRSWRLCQSKFSSRRTSRNSFGSIRAFRAISIAVILAIFLSYTDLAGFRNIGSRFHSAWNKPQPEHSIRRIGLSVRWGTKRQVSLQVGFW